MLLSWRSGKAFNALQKHEAALRELKAVKSGTGGITGSRKLLPKMAFAFAIIRNKYLAHLGSWLWLRGFVCVWLIGWLSYHWVNSVLLVE